MTSPTGALGASIQALDGVSRVTGRIRYASDARSAGALHGAILGSPHAHARIVSIDTSALRGMTGVRAIVTSRQLLERSADPYLGGVIRDRPPVALDKVRFAGEPVAAVAAVDEDVAREALERIRIEYEPLEAVFDPLAALAPGAPMIHERIRRVVPWRPEIPAEAAGPNVVHRFFQRRGDVEEGFRRAALVVENVFVSPPVQHAALEPHSTIATATPNGAVVLTASQNPFVLQRQLAQLLGVPTAHVRITVPPIGGAFGGRLTARLEPIALLLSLEANGRPVRIELNGSESFALGVQHPARVALRTGVDGDGRLIAQEAICHYTSGAYADTTPNLISRAYAATGPYLVPNLVAESFGVYTNQVPSASFRGYGITQVCWAHEAQMDAIAAAVGMDPLAIRLLNVVHPGDPFTTGEPLPDLHYDDLFRSAAQAIGWSEGTRSIVGTRVRAKGLAATIKGMATPTTSNATIRLHGDGSIDALVGTVDMGQGSGTALAQIVAAALAVNPSAVTIRVPDTDAAPFDSMTAASRSTFCMGLALRDAAARLVEQLAAYAATELEAAPSDLVLGQNGFSVRGAPTRSVDLVQVVRASGRQIMIGAGSFIADRSQDGHVVRLDAEGQGYGSAEWHPAVAACEVEVDLDTGHVRVIELSVALDIGTVVNPRLANLQVEGSAMFAIGQALFEEVRYDENGHLANRTLSDYQMPSSRDVPEVLLVDFRDPVGSHEIHGVGETALPPVRAAVVNAVGRAIGRSMTHLPLTPETILRAVLTGPLVAGEP